MAGNAATSETAKARTAKDMKAAFIVIEGGERGKMRKVEMNVSGKELLLNVGEEDEVLNWNL